MRILASLKSRHYPKPRSIASRRRRGRETIFFEGACSLERAAFGVYSLVILANSPSLHTFHCVPLLRVRPHAGRPALAGLSGMFSPRSGWSCPEPSFDFPALQQSSPAPQDVCPVTSDRVYACCACGMASFNPSFAPTRPDVDRSGFLAKCPRGAFPPDVSVQPLSTAPRSDWQQQLMCALVPLNGSIGCLSFIKFTN